MSMRYQTKYHKLICDSFRILSFVFVVITLMAAVCNLWTNWPGREVVDNFLVTTGCIFLATITVSLIFYEPKSLQYSIKETIRTHSNNRMSQVVVRDGIVYLAGQVALNSRGQSVTLQTEEILAAVDRYLGEVNSDKKQILSATVWLSDVASFDEFNKVWDAWVPQGHVPARACVEAKLVAPDFNVEVAVVAAVKN